MKHYIQKLGPQFVNPLLGMQSIYIKLEIHFPVFKYFVHNAHNKKMYEKIPILEIVIVSFLSNILNAAFIVNCLSRNKMLILGNLGREVLGSQVTRNVLVIYDVLLKVFPKISTAYFFLSLKKCL